MISRRVTIVLVILAFGLGNLVGVLGYVWFVGGSGEPSQPVSAPTLSLGGDSSSDETPVAPTNAPAESSTEQAAAPSGADERVLFRIDKTESEARFNIYEELAGTPKTVIGRTDEIAGDIIVDFVNPANSELGQIVLSSRDLATDNEMRNRALRSQILQSAQDDYEFISFTPTQLTGLPASAAVGDSFTFQVTGDLVIRAITQPVTFNVSLTAASQDRIEGLATTVVTRSQYNLQIPNAPGVANVGEEVTLEMEFVAGRVQE